ncbi:MAG: TonB-dependent receptor [Acidobacteriota bacterium]|jgi:outer membrane receptor protein involved in Fe transport
MIAMFRSLFAVRTTKYLIPAAACFLSAQAATAQEEPPAQVRTTVQVTATREPRDVESVPASIDVITAEELRARRINTLGDALALVAGVNIAPGGDGGPAGGVPEFWGLKEMDAYLLVVDGVPLGGAYNPELAVLDLSGVERIEVLRGPAPVMYGATSFVGVVHVIHYDAGDGPYEVTAAGGNYDTGSGSFAGALPGTDSFSHSVVASINHSGFRDPRTDYTRGHFLYRGGFDAGGGQVHFDFDAVLLGQSPASPHPRQGTMLSTEVPIDANHNPLGAMLDRNRYQISGGYRRPFEGATLNVKASFAGLRSDVLRGFLREVEEGPDNARGFEQDIEVNDLYLDANLAFDVDPRLQVVVGADLQRGEGKVASQIFDYEVDLDGNDPPGPGDLDYFEMVDVEDERSFAGIYGQIEWSPVDRLWFEIGLRLNITEEDREGEAEPIGEEEEGDEEEAVMDSRSDTRLSGVFGVNYMAWNRGPDALWVFGDYRNTFKPAAYDFGPEAEGGILEPETAQSVEGGIKFLLADGRLRGQASGFLMNFENLVLPDNVNGVPTLINAGKERFEGIEGEFRWELYDDLYWNVAAAWHNAHFLDYERLFDGVPFRLDGNRLELSPNILASTGIAYTPLSGIQGSLLIAHVGDRYLDKRNRALADPYTTINIAAGYAFRDWLVRFEGRNLSDERPPISESEFGDAQYYLLPARTFVVSLLARF